MSQTEEICNPELAEEFIAIIFATLYESRPIRIGLDAQQITAIDYDVELFNWLKNEGYIKMDGLVGNVWTLGRPQLTYKAINNMMLDMLAVIARKDYQDRRRRQKEGIEKAKNEGKFRGWQVDLNKHEQIYKLRVINGLNIADTAKLADVS
ncbi:hypothetical protein C9J12_27395 [Photobacterium frigidiphilum]|uniref:Resolvase/invertase-type recombinase catalytic domain-containing protein n=1 Tax=Photobacterium frigidiphilum TaxID=264736 RepID=A0A2T3J6Y7_9GAMM|nr:hypothetical protein C9J12_27395 [Photobacterium frigidiphilum]